MHKIFPLYFIIIWLCTVTSHASPNEKPYISPTPDWARELTTDYKAKTIPGSILNGVQYLMVNNQQKYTDNETYFYTQFAQKVVNESGLSEASTIEISFDPNFQKLFFHKIQIWRNGKIMNRLDMSQVKILHREESLERQIYDGSLTATLLLKDVRIGDVVEYTYSIIGENPVLENRAYASFNLGWSPIIDKRYIRILLPEERTAFIKTHNSKLTPTITVKDNFKQYTWDIDDTQGQNTDEDIPLGLSSYPWVEISEIENWEQVAKWDIKNFSQPETLSTELIRAINNISNTYKTPKERYRAILEYTQKEIRYLGIEIGLGSYIPRKPSITVENRFGDCKDKTYLFLTMARAMGLPASAAMVHSKKGQYLTERLPSLTVFNHVIIQISLNGKNYWLDPTLLPQGGDLDHLYQPDYGHALIIDKDTSTLTPMTSKKIDHELKMVEENFDLRQGYDKPVIYTVKTIHRSWHADDIRSYFTNNSIEKISKNYINYFADTYPDITSAAPITYEDDKINNIFIVYEKYQLKDPWIPNEKNKTIELHFDSYEMDNAISKTKTPIRSMPLKIQFPIKARQKITIQFPDKWNLNNERFVVENEAFIYSLTESYKNNTLTLDYQYETLKKSIPATSSQQYNKDIDKILRQSDYYIHMSDPSAAGEILSEQADTDLLNIVIIGGGLIVALILIIVFTLYFRREFTNRVSLSTPYYPVAVSKFILMSITTFGIYTFFWFFANWKYVQIQMQSSMWPMARAAFSTLTYFFLIKKFNSDPGTNKSLNIYFAAILGLAYLFFSRLGENLDNGALTIACLIISTLSLVPFVYRINRNVENYNVQFIENSRYRASSFIGISVGGILLTTIFLSGIYYIPFGQTMYGNSIWNKDIAYLKEQGLLSNIEKLEYLSTVELFSIKDSGSLFTNKRIISYWSDENTGKLNTEKLLLSDINRARLEEGADIWSQNLRITLKNNDEYLFELSIDDDIQNKVLKFINSQINNEVKVRVTYREN